MDVANNQGCKMRRWWLLASAALVGGTWAAGVKPLWRPELAVPEALILVGWLPLWQALEAADWLTPLRAWQGWEPEAPLARWPYLQPGTPGAWLHHRLRQARAWWRDCGRASLAAPLRAALLALGLSLLLSLAAGRAALLLTVLLITLSEIALLWDGSGRMPAFFCALMGVGLPWMLGSSLGSGSVWMGVMALALSVAVAAFVRPGRLAGLALVPLVLLLVGLQKSWAAGWAALGAIPLVWLSLWPDEMPARWDKVELWLVLLVAVTAGALA